MYIDIGDTKLFFEVYGSKLVPAGAETVVKPTVIFLHGGVGFFDHTVYVDFWSQFADVAEVIFLDHRGGGRSHCDDQSTWNLKQWGDDIYQFCQKLHIEKPILAGISFGGMAAMSCVIQYPDFPGALIMTDTDAHIDQEHMLELVKQKAVENNKSPDELVAITKQILSGPITAEISGKYFFDVLNLFGNPDHVLDKFENTDPNLVNLTLGEDFLTGELLTFDYRDQLKKTPCPVLFLSGDQGPMHSVKTAHELIAAFPEDNIQYQIFENAKPACYEFYPEESAKLIRDFIIGLTAK